MLCAGYYAFNVRRVCNHYGCTLRSFSLIESAIYIHTVTLLNTIIYFGWKAFLCRSWMCCSFNSIFVLIIVYSIVIMLVASPSFPSAFAFIRALVVIHESARSLFFKPQMTAICHVCLFRIFKRFLCMFHWPLYFFSSASRKSTAEHFNSPFLLFTVSFRLGLGFVRSFLRFIFIFHIFSCWRYLIEKYSSFENFPWNTLQPIRFW